MSGLLLLFSNTRNSGSGVDFNARITARIMPLLNFQNVTCCQIIQARHALRSEWPSIIIIIINSGVI